MKTHVPGVKFSNALIRKW